MRRTTLSQPSPAALRPWPYGPPLRGRAPRGAAGLRVATCGHALPVRHAAPAGPLSGCQATAPVGGLACIHLLYCQ